MTGKWCAINRMQCQVKGCNLDAIYGVEKIVSKLCIGEEDYKIVVCVPVCREHARQLSFGKKELCLPLKWQKEGHING